MRRPRPGSSRPTWCLALAALGTGLAGCATTPPPGPDRLVVAADEYERAFDAAVEAARVDGLPAALRDRRSGIIETEARIAPSIFEPWSPDPAGLPTRLENTISFQRRRVRFEFTPLADTTPTPPSTDPAAAVAGPDVLGTREPDVDLTTSHEPLEVRVTVWVERAHQPGLRRDTWSRQATSRTRITLPDGDGKPLPSTFWTPVSRDRELEERLLAAVETALASPAPDAEAPGS